MTEIAAALRAGYGTESLYAAIMDIGPAAHGMVPALAAALDVQVAREAPTGRVDEHCYPPWPEDGSPALALRAIGPAAIGALPNLRAALRDGWGVAIDAVEAIGALGPAARDAVPDLIVFAMRRIGDVVPAALAAIDPAGDVTLAALREADAPRPLIAETIGRLGRKDEIPRLVAWLDDDDARVRRVALAALASFGPDAAAALPAIERGLETWDADEDAVLALAAIDPARIPALCERILARREDVDVGEKRDDMPSGADLATLGALGARARTALPALLKHVRDPRYASAAAVVTVAKIDPEGDAWRRTALRWLRWHDDGLQAAAAEAIEVARCFTPETRDALLRSGNEHAHVLAQFDALPPEAAPRLLSEPERGWETKCFLGGALARVASISRAQVPPLLRLTAFYPDDCVGALARVDDDGRAALRAFIDAHREPDAPPSPEALARAMEAMGLTREDVRRLVSPGLPDPDCAKVLAWLE
jgi:hypothetical protein